MEQDSATRFAELFGPLSGVQTIDLGVVVKGQISSQVSTRLKYMIGSRIEARAGAKALLVSVRFEASAVDQDKEMFTGRCQTIGLWPVKSASDIPEELVSKLSAEVAAPLIFTIARQNLADTLSKAGLHADNWPWHMTGVEPLPTQTGESQADWPKTPDKEKSRRKKAAKKK